MYDERLFRRLKRLAMLLAFGTFLVGMGIGSTIMLWLLRPYLPQ